MSAPDLKIVPMPIEFIRLDALQGDALTALHGALAGDHEAVAQEIAESKAALYAIQERTSGQHMAYIVTRIEHMPDRSEYVVVGVAGRALHSWAPIVKRYAAAIGCRSIRAHVNIMGQARSLARYGFQKVDEIYRAEITDNG